MFQKIYFALFFQVFLGLTSHLFANEIVTAIEQENQVKAIEEIKKAKKKNPRYLDSQDENGNAPIHFAIHKGFEDVVVALIEQGADLNRKNLRGERPTTLAFRLNMKSILDRLFDAGAKFNYAFLSHHTSRLAITATAISTTLRRGSIVDKYSQLFESNIEEFLTDDMKLQQLIYLQPMFCTEKSLYIRFLSLLKQDRARYESSILKFLYYQAQAGYPSGSKNVAVAGKELDALLNRLGQLPQLDKAITKGMISSINRQSRSSLAISTEHKDKFDYMNVPAQRLAWLFTARDRRLLRAVTLKEIRIWADDNEKSNAIIALANHFNLTARFIAYSIVSEKNKKRRNAIIQHWIDVGYELYLLKNYHGVMQILTALNGPAVLRLYAKKDLDKKCKKKYLTYKNLHIVSENYKVYRQLMNDARPDEHFLAPFPMVMHDLAMVLEVLEKTRTDEHLNFENLKQLASLLKEAVSIRNKANYKFDFSERDHMEISLVSNLPNIELETIDEFSSFILKWKFPRPNPQQKNLEEWDSSEFVFWLRENGYKKYIEPLFIQNIYNGKKLIELLKKERSHKDQLELLENKFNMSYGLAAKIITLNSPRQPPENKFVGLWDCLDLCLWLSHNDEALRKLFSNNIFSGNSLIQKLDTVPLGYARLGVLTQLGFSVPEANQFIALLNSLHMGYEKPLDSSARAALPGIN